MPPFVNLIPSLVLGVLSVLALVLKDRAKLIAGRILLSAATLLVVGFYAMMLVNPTGINKLQTGAAAARVEVPLKIHAMFSVGIGRVWEAVFSRKPGDKRIIEVSTAGIGPVAKTAVVALDKFVKESPDPAVTKAKLIAVLCAGAKKKDCQRADKLSEDLVKSALDREHKIGEALRSAFFKAPTSAEKLQEHEKTIETTLPPGWFRDYILLSLYRAGDKRLYDTFATKLEDNYCASFYKASALFSIGVIGFLVGLVFLIIQLGFVSRRDLRQIAEGEKPEIAVPLSSAFVVLVAWQATQICMGQLLKLLPEGALKALGHNPIGLALFMMVSYLVTMGPAILYIHFLVLKPRGLSLVKSLNIRWKTASAGPFKMLTAGVLYWCACLPLVVLASILAGYTGSTGSDNPVLAQIVSAAKGPDPTVLILLFFTIAVLAPICEEIIFRGFLYGVLRSNKGAFLALIGSAFVFSAIHLDKGGLFMLFSIGFVLALCYERTRSLIPCFITHGMWNGGTLILSVALFS